MTATQNILLRPATAADGDALVRLALLDDTRPPRGETLLAELDGDVVAALETATGRVIADPFRRTDAVGRALRALAAGGADAERAARSRGRFVAGRLGRAVPRLALE